MNNPIIIINHWLNQEKLLGSPSPDRVVLATSGKDNIPHSRIVALYTVDNKGILFFTQSGTRKVVQLSENPQASMTLWLPLQQRQVNMEGTTLPLSIEENQSYWQSLPKIRQLRFLSSASTSAQPIQSIHQLEKRYHMLSEKYAKTAIPMSEHYCGFRLVPKNIYFYTLGQETFSTYMQYQLMDGQWVNQLLSP